MKKRLTDVFCKAHAGIDAGLGSQNAKHQREQRHDNHGPAVHQHGIDISKIHAQVDDLGHLQGDEDLHNDLSQNKNGRENGLPSITGLQIAPKLL